jgi:hypothetical protein
MSTALRSTEVSSLEEVLEEARHRIEVSPAELDEARRRRDAIAGALRAEFPGSRVYVNGSVAHGDALTPLSDVDLGVVVPDPDHAYGPGCKGPSELKQRAADAIRVRLRAEYGDLRVDVVGRKRSILIRFRDPVAPGLPDFTADVIVAIDNLGDRGLFIPRHDGWDRSDPEAHTLMVRQAVEQTDVVYSLVVRLVKHWSRTHEKPLCSWHIKALALGCLVEPTTLILGLQRWFEHAASELANGETADPAGVAPHPIKTIVSRTEAVRMLRDAAARLELAVRLMADGWDVLAIDELAKLFNDAQMLPSPDQGVVTAQEAARVRTRRAADTKLLGVPALLTGVGSGADRPRPNVRSWAP